MSTPHESLKVPARGGQSLADKLQKLVLEQPAVAVQLEQLVDLFLAKDGRA